MSIVGQALAFHLGLIGDLSAEDRQAVTALRGEVRDLRRNGDILKKGDVPDESVVVLKGLLLRYSVTPEGTKQIHSFYLQTDAPCLETLYMDYMDNSLAAAIDSTIGIIPHDQLYALIDERPGVRKLLWRQTLIQAAIFREWLMRNSKLPAHAAVAHLFCEMYMRATAARLVTDNSFDFPITQETLAEALGLSPVHTNRTVMLLRDAGTVDWRGGKLTVKDWEKLSSTAEFDPHYLHLRSVSSHLR